MKERMCPKAKITEKLLSGLHELPSLDPIVNKVITMVSDPATSTRELATEIGKDPGLTAKILRLSNSAFYGLPKQIAKIEQGVLILGFYEIRNIVVLTEAVCFMTHADDTQLINELWEHLLLTAIAAKLLGIKINYPKIDELYLSGLLHDIGKVVYVFRYPQEYRELTARKEYYQDQIENEKELFGVTHEELGKELLTRWNFPDQFIKAVNSHHAASSQELTDVSAIVSLADNLSYYCLEKSVHVTELESNLRPYIGDTSIDDFAEQVKKRYELENCALGLQ